VKKRHSLIILGTRGIPAAHGGFETFAEHLALFLAARGWHVVVYCQANVAAVTRRVTVDMWHGVERRHVSVAGSGPRATLEFDWHSIRDATTIPGVCLVLGYNSAVFLTYPRLLGRRILTNMDGIEWRRRKWGLAARAWLWGNEWIAAWVSHRLVADHPVIADHLATRRPRAAIATIPYGGNPVTNETDAHVRALGLEPGRYLVCIARIEPDNNILTIVEAFSRRARGAKLVVVGNLCDDNPYHDRIREAASVEVVFAGAIYDKEALASLRHHARAYLHGHTVGGTNPSLVEALWAGNAVIAHDNPYNRWTAGEAGCFFADADGCDRLIDRALTDHAMVARLGQAARDLAASRFDWTDILGAYEREALRLMPGQVAAPIAVIEPTAGQAMGRRVRETL
jgi:glycosyltransferase involved in cell wall biosynthesis